METTKDKHEIKPLTKSASNTYKYVIIAGVIAAILFLCLNFIVIVFVVIPRLPRFIDKPDIILSTPTVSNVPTLSPSPTTIATPGNSGALSKPVAIKQQITTLQNNTVYFAKYKGQYILFLHNGSDRNFNSVANEAGADQIDSTAVKFTDLTSTKVVFIGGNQQEIYLESFVIQDGIVFFSMTYGENNNYAYPTTSAVNAFTLATNSLQTVFSKGTNNGSSDEIVTWGNGVTFPTPNYNGALSIESIQGNFLVLRVPQCYGCDEIPPGTLLIANLVSGTARTYGSVGAVSLNPQTNVVTFKTYVSVPNPTCTDYCPPSYQAIGTAGRGKLP